MAQYITRTISTSNIIYSTADGEECIVAPGEVTMREAAGRVYDEVKSAGVLLRVEYTTHTYRMTLDEFVARAELVEPRGESNGRRGRPRKNEE